MKKRIKDYIKQLVTEKIKGNKSRVKPPNRYLVNEQGTIEGCETAADFGGFSTFEVAIDACCAKCATLTGSEDPCYNFCEDRCCELCMPPEGGCPENFSFNQETCHCEHDNLSTNPCQVFSMMNIASQESVCNACANGTANEYQSNFCDCCPSTSGGTSGGNVIYPGKGGGIEKPFDSKPKIAARPQRPIRRRR